MHIMLRVCIALCVTVVVCRAAPAKQTLDAAQSAAIEPENDREIIEIVNLGNFGQSDRDKRDISMLRQLFPGLAQIVDNLIQEVTRQLFRVVGRAVLSGGLGGGDGGGEGGSGGRGSVKVSLPTFPPDEDEDEEESDEDNNTDTSSTTTSTDKPAEEEDNTLSGSESQASEVRVKFDEQPAASEAAPLPADEADGDDADRNKRFLPFGGGVDHGGAAAGGSGNFLFDIIRLVAGSGHSEHSDVAAGASAVEADVGKGADGYTEGIPGPITRLFVIANRGIANLIQDLILRLAQTSERIVNFKARLITALI